MRRFKVIIITNQSGIGRGYYTEDDFHVYMEKMISFYLKKNAKIDDYYFSPFYEFSNDERYKIGENLRKPNVGMIEMARQKYNLCLKSSILVGDKITDIYAGERAKIESLVLYDKSSGCTNQTDRYFKVGNLNTITGLCIW